MQAKFGETLSPYIIERISMAKGQNIVVSILPCNILIAKLHYLPEGYIFCFDGICCEDMGAPSVRYGLPIVQYQADNKGKILSNELIWDKMLVLGFIDYNKLLTNNEILQNAGSDIYKKNIMVSCTDSSYQKKDFFIMGDCSWPKMTTKEIMKEHIEVFLSKGELTFGRKINEEEYIALRDNVDRPITDRNKSSNKLNLPSTNRIVIDDSAFDELINGSSQEIIETTIVDDEVPF